MAFTSKFETVRSEMKEIRVRGNAALSLSLSAAFPSNSATFRSFLLRSPPFSLLFCNSRRERVDLSHKSRAKKGTNEEKPQGGLREGNEGREAGRIVGGVESISKLQATLFDPLSPPPLLVSQHPAVFSPASSLRKSHSSYSTHPASRTLSGSLPFGR